MCYHIHMDKKYDYALENLINLDGYIAEIGEGYWIKIEAKKVAQSKEKPYGIKYSLTLHDTNGERVLGYDNAHAIPFNPSFKGHDHMHKGGKIIKYNYNDAAKLLEDFWKDVERITERRIK